MASNTSAAGPKTHKTVADVMTREMVTLKSNDTLRLADDMMNLAKLRHFPVMDESRVMGMVHQADLLRSSMRSLVEHPQDSPRRALGAVAIRDVMTPATMIAAGTSIQEAAQILVEKDIECLLVMEADRLVGLVTRTDLLRELATPQES
jgi:CBS domain-containing membrane protein